MRWRRSQIWVPSNGTSGMPVVADGQTVWWPEPPHHRRRVGGVGAPTVDDAIADGSYDGGSTWMVTVAVLESYVPSEAWYVKLVVAGCLGAE